MLLNTLWEEWCIVRMMSGFKNRAWNQCCSCPDLFFCIASHGEKNRSMCMYVCMDTRVDFLKLLLEWHKSQEQWWEHRCENWLKKPASVQKDYPAIRDAILSTNTINIRIVNEKLSVYLHCKARWSCTVWMEIQLTIIGLWYHRICSGSFYLFIFFYNPPAMCLGFNFDGPWNGCYS